MCLRFADHLACVLLLQIEDPPLWRLIRDIQMSWQPSSWVLALKGYAKILTYKARIGLAERIYVRAPSSSVLDGDQSGVTPLAHCPHWQRRLGDPLPAFPSVTSVSHLGAGQS